MQSVLATGLLQPDAVSAPAEQGPGASVNTLSAPMGHRGCAGARQEPCSGAQLSDQGVSWACASTRMAVTLQAQDGATRAGCLCPDTARQRPGRVQVVDIQPSSPGPKELSYDAEWLAILRETHDLLTPGTYTRLPPPWTGGLGRSLAPPWSAWSSVCWARMPEAARRLPCLLHRGVLRCDPGKHPGSSLCTAVLWVRPCVLMAARQTSWTDEGLPEVPPLAFVHARRVLASVSRGWPMLCCMPALSQRSRGDGGPVLQAQPLCSPRLPWNIQALWTACCSSTGALCHVTSARPWSHSTLQCAHLLACTVAHCGCLHRRQPESAAVVALKHRLTGRTWMRASPPLRRQCISSLDKDLHAPRKPEQPCARRPRRDACPLPFQEIHRRRHCCSSLGVTTI